MYCNQCGAGIADDARFCQRCGASVANVAPTGVAPPRGLNSPTEVDVPVQTPRPPGTVWRCPVCQRLNRPVATRCACGAPFQSDGARQVPSMSEERGLEGSREERLGITAQCHLCRGNRMTTGRYYEFGLG